MSRSDIIKAAHATVAASSGVIITYTRGAASVTMTAVRGRSTLETTTEGGFVTQSDSHDWFIESEDLILGSDTTVPKRGDVISYASGSVVESYQVCTPPFSPMRHDRSRFRVHTNYTGSEAAS